MGLMHVFEAGLYILCGHFTNCSLFSDIVYLCVRFIRLTLGVVLVAASIFWDCLSFASITMEENDKNGVSSINVSEQNDAVARDDAKRGAATLEKQTRTRRLFSTPQLFAFSLVYLGTWYSIAT